MICRLETIKKQSKQFIILERIENHNKKAKDKMNLSQIIFQLFEKSKDNWNNKC